MRYPTKTVDKFASAKVREQIRIKGNIRLCMFAGLRLFVFALLDAGYGVETVQNATEKAVKDWEKWRKK